VAVKIDDASPALRDTDLALVMSQLRDRGRVQLLATALSLNKPIPDEIGERLECLFGMLAIDGECVTAEVRDRNAEKTQKYILLTLTDGPETDPTELA
jgi:hypothetical protein